VLRGLEARGEVEAPHGRLTLGILIFQDLSVVPMILLLPLLAARDGAGVGHLVKALGVAILVLAGVVLGARLVVPRLLRFIAQTRQRDLFVLAVFLVCIGTAWAASLAGVSLALGAFLAGLVIADSEYKSQALATLIPFREVFTSLFFISVGMLLDPVVLYRDLWPILGMLLNLLVGKFVLVFLAAALMRLPLRVCALSATALAQVGEFFFVVMYAAAPFDLVDPVLQARLPVVVILSMLVTPLLLMLGPHVAAGVGRLRVLDRMLGVRAVDEADSITTYEDHVIIAGWGVAGQELAHSLRHFGIPYLVVDLNIENVRRAEAEGEPVYFGDVTNVEVLERLGARHARELVLVINDPSAAGRAVEAARRVSRALHILVRSRYVADAPPLLASGASEVIPAEVEAAVEIASRVLARHHVDGANVESVLNRIRSRRVNELPV
jgi:monovalent cation:H+ antiporter-2, CPA2 family